MKKLKQLFKIFTSCLFISTFTFGGGYVILPLMKKKFMEELKWLEEDEMIDMTSISQSSPGSIAVNASLLLGYKVAGIMGALFALVGTVLPSLIIVIMLSIFYNIVQDNEIVRAILKGMQAGVAALICDISLNLSTSVGKQKNILNIIIMIIAFILVFFLKVNVAYIIISCILIGVILPLVKIMKRKRNEHNSINIETENLEEIKNQELDRKSSNSNEDNTIDTKEKERNDLH